MEPAVGLEVCGLVAILCQHQHGCPALISQQDTSLSHHTPVIVQDTNALSTLATTYLYELTNDRAALVITNQ